LYCSEVAVDTALGLVGMSGYFMTFVLSLCTEPLMMSGLQEQGTFYMFGIISLIGAVWCYYYLLETSTCKTDQEKKDLYNPLKKIEEPKVVDMPSDFDEWPNNEVKSTSNEENNE
jgi:hypothetical protein